MRRGAEGVEVRRGDERGREIDVAQKGGEEGKI